MLAVAVLATALWVPISAQRPDLDGALDSIRRAFLGDEAAVIQQHFSADRPIYVSIPRFEKGRFLGPGPLRALLDRVVADTNTVTFEFTRPDDPPLSSRRDTGFASRSLQMPTEPRRTSDQRHVYVKGRWTYVEAASGERRAVNLYLAMQRQPNRGDWRIVELKAFD
jgi:hypothetical protein